MAVLLDRPSPKPRLVECIDWIKDATDLITLQKKSLPLPTKKP